MNPNATPLKLINDVPTRWNSTYYAIERLVRLAESLAATVGVLHNPVILPTEEEWALLQEISKILKPFEVVTVELSSEKQTTLSKVILIIKGLISSLERIRPTVISQIGTDLIVSLLSSICSRFGNPENNIIMAKCTFLDSRFKTKGFSNEDNIKEIKRNIQDDIISIIRKNQLHDKIIESGPDITMDSEQIPDHTLNSIKNDDPIWQDFDRAVKNSVSSTNSNPTATAMAELRMYLDDAILNRKEDPLIWWKDRQKIYPWLSILARKYLSIVATSVPCERIFSKAGQVITERRNRLKSTNVEKILFLHCNKNIL